LAGGTSMWFSISLNVCHAGDNYLRHASEQLLDLAGRPAERVGHGGVFRVDLSTR
jgi:hypothetical protein